MRHSATPGKQQEVRRGFRHERGRRAAHRGMQIYEEMSETTNFCRVLPPTPPLPARMCTSFHTLIGAFRRRREALAENSTSFSQKLPVFAENSTSFSQKLPVFAENSTTFRRKFARLRALRPAVAAFSPIVGRHSPLIPHRLPNNPSSPLSIFAVTHSKTFATTKPK